ncbi:MAG: RNA methyltransferase [Clostridia bacterium]|nr:RNA methyltransferase [Clostridia bacterium]
MKKAIKEEQKFSDSNIFEGMTSISALLNSNCGNDRTIERILVDRKNQKTKAPQISFLSAKAKERGFALEFVDGSEIDALSIGSTHGGFLAFCGERHLPALTVEAIKKDGFYVFLEGIEDPYNFGYTVRSLYAAGVDGIILPERNWMSAAGVVARASAGCSELIPMMVANAEEVAACFSKCGYTILCSGIRDSVSIFDTDFPLPVLLVIGGEKRGISRKMLEKADQIVRIDYGRNFKGSLSAASAATVMAFEILRQNRKSK